MKNGGVLIYSTCSYSKEEDEEICKWISDEFKVEGLRLKVEEDWGIIESGNGYRFWPDKVKGEGFFISCFRKTDREEQFEHHKKQKAEKISNTEMNVLDNYIKYEGYAFLRMGKMIHAVPADLLSAKQYFVIE